MRRWVCAALGLGVLAFAAPAGAAVMIATVSGTVGAMTSNSAGAFDSTHASITGEAFTAVFVFNSDAPDAVVTPTSIDARGGLCCLSQSPVSSATLTINGITLDLGRSPTHGPFDSEVLYDAAAGTVFFQAGRDDAIDSNLMIRMAGPNIPLSLGAGFSLSQAAGSSSFNWDDIANGHDRAALLPEFLSVTAASVPEPATWAMMLTGFLGLGAVLRRRRAVASVGLS